MGNQIEIFKTKDNQTEIKVRFEQETVWLDAHRIASLFTVNRPAIVKHIQNIYKSNELPENATCSILEQVDCISNSLALYIFPMCLTIAGRFTPNIAAIVCASSQTVSFSNFTVTSAPFGVLYISI